jgi:hypothetical protein
MTLIEKTQRTAISLSNVRRSRSRRWPNAMRRLSTHCPEKRAMTNEPGLTRPDFITAAPLAFPTIRQCKKNEMTPFLATSSHKTRWHPGPIRCRVRVSVRAPSEGGAVKESDFTYDSGNAPSEKSGSCRLAQAAHFIPQSYCARFHTIQMLVDAWRTYKFEC